MLALFSVIIIHSAPFDEVAQGPEPPKEGEEFSLKGDKTITVTQIQFQGNKAISTTQLQRLVGHYENRTLSESDLQELQQRIVLLYRTKGYNDVEVILPIKQKTGTLTVIIKEGSKVSP